MDGKDEGWVRGNNARAAARGGAKEAGVDGVEKASKAKRAQVPAVLKERIGCRERRETGWTEKIVPWLRLM